tara:strand:- start:307 stop:537 length:231 start_codon:yes stop_codon:yes gene_type:complete
MKGFKSFIKSSKGRSENPDSTLEYSTGGLPPTNGKCPDGFVMHNELGGCVPAGPDLHDMSMPEVGDSYPEGTPKHV